MVDPTVATIIPSYLKAGDTVAIICSAEAIYAGKMQSCCNALEKWGLNVRFGKTIGKRWQWFDGTDQERLEDFQELIDDVATETSATS